MKKVKPTQEPRERKNTAVYVTNLPADIEEDEIDRIFSRCGLIAEEIDSKKPRIKLYLDDKGNPKGDALIVYFRPESVNLAIQMLDDTQLRLGEGPMTKVVAADFSYKKIKEEGATEKKGKKAGEQKKVIKKTQKLNKCVLRFRYK